MTAASKGLQVAERILSSFPNARVEFQLEMAYYAGALEALNDAKTPAPRRSHEDDEQGTPELPSSSVYPSVRAEYRTMARADAAAYRRGIEEVKW